MSQTFSPDTTTSSRPPAGLLLLGLALLGVGMYIGHYAVFGSAHESKMISILFTAPGVIMTLLGYNVLAPWVSLRIARNHRASNPGNSYDENHFPPVILFSVGLVIATFGVVVYCAPEFLGDNACYNVFGAGTCHNVIAGACYIIGMPITLVGTKKLAFWSNGRKWSKRESKA